MRISGESIRRGRLKVLFSWMAAAAGGWRLVPAGVIRVGFILMLLTFCGAAEAGVLRVKAGTATGAQDGSSWPDAYADLQAALTAAQPYDEIWVAAGTYKPTTTTDRTVSFVMKPAVALYGGFVGTEETSDTRNWTANATVLSGDIGAVGDASDNSYHVVVGKFQGVLDGFTITGGNANGTLTNGNGGGMINDSVSPTIANCIFTDNSASGPQAYGCGGGMYNTNASPTVTNCTFTNNTARYNGGGMGSESSSAPTVTRCTLTNNTAGNGGGMSGGDATNCTFTNNTASGSGDNGYGGGKCNGNATNCTFTNNTAARTGGGLAGDSATSCTFTGNTGGGMSGSTATNCTFTGNIGGGMFGGHGAEATNCTFTGNSSDEGGGMLWAGATNCTFTNNTASQNGGGLAVGNATNCTFTNNTAGGYGGGMSGDPMLGGVTATNCTFTDNTASYGGGMYYNAAVAINCTFMNNAAIDAGGGIYNTTGGDATNCIFWKDSAPLGAEIYKASGGLTFTSCDIQGSGGSGGLYWDSTLGADGGGNLDVDPLFVDAANPAGPDGIWRTADDGLALTTGSLCIDAGLVAGAPVTDILGNPRSGAPDIGAYEFQGSAPPASLTAPQGRLAITYTITTPSTGPAGQTVQYTYHWTSDGGDDVTHGPTTALSDTLMDPAQPGETWTLTVTPSAGDAVGPSATAKVKIQSPQNGVTIWTCYP